MKTLPIISALAGVMVMNASVALVRYSVNTGNWEDTNTWAASSGGAAGASVPGTGDWVVIEKGMTVTLVDTRECDSLYIINSDNSVSTKLVISGGTLTVTGGVGIHAISSTSRDAVLRMTGTSLLTVQGDLRINSTKRTASFDVQGSSAAVIGGSMYLTCSLSKVAKLTASASASITITGNIIYCASQINNAFITLSGSSTLNLGGSLNRSCGWYGDLQSDSTTTVNFMGASPQVLTTKFYNTVTNYWQYGNIRINNTAGVTLDTNITQGILNNRVWDDIHVQTGTLHSGGWSIELANGKRFRMDSGATYSTTTVSPTGGMLDTTTTAYHVLDPGSTVIFAAAADQFVPGLKNNAAYADVVIGGTNIKYLFGSVDIDGDLLINSTLDANVDPSCNINIAGNWTNNGTFGERGGRVEFDGSATQVISGAAQEQFSALRINKSAGDVELSGLSISVDSLLEMLQGDIIPGSNNVIMNGGSTSLGSSQSSYVHADQGGRMVKYYVPGENPFDYPVGDIDDYSPFWIQVDLSTTYGGSDYISVSVTDSVHPENVFTDYITRYWTLDGGGFASLSYFFRGIYTDADISGAEGDMISNSWNGSWQHHDAVNAAVNTVFNTSSLNSIPAGAGITAGGGLLPIELMEFKARCINRAVALNWATLFEVNNARFAVERLSGKKEWEEIGSVAGSGTSYGRRDYSFTDNTRPDGISYYRLRQYDFDGGTTIHGPVSASASASMVIKVYPNPAKAGQDLHFDAAGLKEDQEILVVLMDQFGREIFGKVLMEENGSANIALSQGSNLNPGVYYVSSASDNSLYRQKLVIISK